MSTIEEVQKLLTDRKLIEFVGRKEDLWFETKSGAAYDLNTPAGRWELAKDVSSLANSEGGYLIVGLKTNPIPEEQTDQVAELDLIAEASFPAGQVSGVLKEYLYPPVAGLEVGWIENEGGGDQGVGFIRVPAQPDRRFTLMAQVVDENSQLRRFVFGFSRRHQSGNIPLTVEQLHKICQDGRSTGAERLTRIENKLDHLVSMAESAEVTEPQSYAEEMEERLKRIIDGNN